MYRGIQYYARGISMIFQSENEKMGKFNVLRIEKCAPPEQ
jgi:hypothetical protein